MATPPIEEKVQQYAAEKAWHKGVLSGKFVSFRKEEDEMKRFRFQVLKWDGLDWVVDDSRHVFVLIDIRTRFDGSIEPTNQLCCVFKGPYDTPPPILK